MCQDFFCFFKNVTHDILLLHILTILPDDCQMENQPHHWTNNVYLFNTFISFLFTHPMWDVTDTEVKTLCTLTISTHTSRVGCDKPRRNTCQDEENFYSHIPCGMWHYAPTVIRECEEFLLTHPVWDVTNWREGTWSCLKISTHTSRVGCDELLLNQSQVLNISTHTSRVGCDTDPSKYKWTLINFYSHIPCGMWPKDRYTKYTKNAISTHTSRVGCDIMTLAFVTASG